MYPNQDNNIPLDVEYRLYNSQTDHHQFDIIPWTKVNRTFKGYEVLLDFSWLIPQDYKLELRLINGNTFKVKEPLKFTVVSDGITTPSIPLITTSTTTLAPTTTTTTTLPPITTTTTTLPSTTTTTTTTLPPTTTTTTLPPNPKIFVSVSPTLATSTYTNTNSNVNSGSDYELFWTTNDGGSSTVHPTQGANPSGGIPLYSSQEITLNWSPSGNVQFETTSAFQVSGMTIDTGITGNYPVTLNAGDNHGWVQFKIYGNLADSFTISANNSVDPTVVFGIPTDSTDTEYVFKSTAGTTYGYDVINSSGMTMDNQI